MGALRMALEAERSRGEGGLAAERRAGDASGVARGTRVRTAVLRRDAHRSLFARRDGSADAKLVVNGAMPKCSEGLAPGSFRARARSEWFGPVLVAIK
jgi:hypothetical protein